MTASHSRKAAIRALMDAEGLTYTAAAERLDRQDADQKARAESTRDDEDRIADLIEENDWTRDQAIAFLDDPANETLCNVCGWTYGMICPECAEGCGCARGCSGWRHHEGWGGGAEDDDESGGAGCPECGAGAGNPYEECDCHLYASDDEDQEAFV